MAELGDGQSAQSRDVRRDLPGIASGCRDGDDTAAAHQATASSDVPAAERSSAVVPPSTIR